MTELRVAVFRRGKRGSLEMLTEYGLSSYGSCPVIGDKIYLPRATYAQGPACHEVVERYFIDDWNYPGWALIVNDVPVLAVKTLGREWEINRQTQIREERQERAAARWGLRDMLARSHDNRQREKYPRLYPRAKDYLKERAPAPKGVKSPIDPPFESWEKRAMNFLVQFAPNKRMPLSSADGLGVSTMKSLQTRGYIGSEESGSGTRRRVYVWVTQKAVDDINADKAFRAKYIPGRDD